ncbi:hypothetical protein LTR04_004310, partial [Oleoguttula sp. CCFEE 6159]
LGCKSSPALPLPALDVLGITNLRRLLKADREKRFPDMLVERQEEMSAAKGRVVSTFRFKVLGKEDHFTSEPKNIQAVLAHQFNEFCLGETRRNNMAPLLGTGIFTADGKQWEHSRAMLRPSFSREQVSDLDLEERHVQNMMRALPVNADGWTAETDLQVLFFRLTLDSATEFLFGESTDSQLINLPENSAAEKGNSNKDEAVFAYAFDKSQRYLARRFRFGENYWLINPQDFKDSNKLVHDFVDHFVQLALNRDLKKEKTAEEGGAKKKKYIFLDALAAQTRDPLELRSQLLNILLAGRDTTASLLAWLFHLLVRHPTILANLRAAILADFGSYTHPKAEITFSTLKNCSYLQHCLNETLRLYPVVPGNSRRAQVDTSLPLGGGPDGRSPVYVRAGQQVDYSVHVMHRRKDLWGADAAAFRPERWVGRRPGWEYLPFNGGPRICIGQQFALTEASYVV